ncbi:anaerobic benzoate catabolism transcriptional regulator [Pseudoruegeria aquimaris]|uniref:Anaerobic benzoate catabolism transcriptional regulator n=1 Tax=Pseudoruegeria aquimaris TaxID=393663 RepID=A0A1Y5SHG4_9RHOB|nr:XRE family transcriptional regulator [Pseudoruegeria aquimaris]SLN40595.1 anaerobic benzoate catabolism transcriptional regulator [Pseudoruegeria aquimaris]
MTDLNTRLAARLRSEREDRRLSLEAVARESGVSRATLSRMETGATSPTTEALGRLCRVYGLPMSALLLAVEEQPQARVARDEQAEWWDADAGFRRRAVSPPARGFAGELLECQLAPGADIRYDGPPTPGLEHHLYLLDGALEVILGDVAHALKAGDALRYRLYGNSRFRCAAETGARYVLGIVRPGGMA